MPGMRVRPALRVMTIGLCLHVAGAPGFCGKPEDTGAAPRSPHRSSRSRSARRWPSGPASAPPVTEVVPPPPPTPLPATSAVLGYKRDATVQLTPSMSMHAGDRFGRGGHSSALIKNPSDGRTGGMPDPESVRIQDDLQRLRNDGVARREFYESLRRTVERVRADGADDGTRAQNPRASVQIVPASADASSETVQPGNREQSPNPQAEPRGGPQARLGASGDQVNRAGYLRVIRWARANGTPVPLALGVAWIESQFQAKPPRGEAGEVGMFQIMPARCRAEGWPVRRLSEPEFNAWLGTSLLARYYREEHDYARAAAKFVAGPKVFSRKYPDEIRAYINWYASSVNSYATYFARYQS
jgi:hypothetical protein